MKWCIKTLIPVEFDIKQVDDSINWEMFASPRLVIVIDEIVYSLYKDKIPAHAEIFSICSAEPNKNWKNAETVLKFFQDIDLLRRETVIAIGGGVLLDLVGFCCSIYRRGVPYVRIPTTLLSIIDASVGAKTSINHFGFRNRLGSFYPPTATLINKSFIKTQDVREISNGIAEILKLAIVLDCTLFELIEINSKELLHFKFQNELIADEIINRSISGMTKELANNLWEKNLQRSVDFGHTFSPIVEMKNISKLLHGEAVILDCLLSCCISNLRGYLSNAQLIRIVKVVRECNLSTSHPDFLDVDLLWVGLQDSMNHRNGDQNLPIPTDIGQYKIINDLTFNDIEQAVERMKMIQ
jgi:3-dehydroquinate synthase